MPYKRGLSPICFEEMGGFFKVGLGVEKQVTPQVTPQVALLLKMLVEPLTRRELQEKLGLRDREHFRQKYIQPALQLGLISMSNPDNPRAADQRYNITELGKSHK